MGANASQNSSEVDADASKTIIELRENNLKSRNQIDDSVVEKDLKCFDDEEDYVNEKNLKVDDGMEEDSTDKCLKPDDYDSNAETNRFDPINDNPLVRSTISHSLGRSTNRLPVTSTTNAFQSAVHCSPRAPLFTNFIQSRITNLQPTSTTNAFKSAINCLHPQVPNSSINPVRSALRRNSILSQQSASSKNSDCVPRQTFSSNPALQNTNFIPPNPSSSIDEIKAGILQSCDQYGTNTLEDKKSITACKASMLW